MFTYKFFPEYDETHIFRTVKSKRELTDLEVEKHIWELDGLTGTMVLWTMEKAGV